MSEITVSEADTEYLYTQDGIDPALAAAVDYATRSNARLPIAMIVQGETVIGELVGANTWLSAMRNGLPAHEADIIMNFLTPPVELEEPLPEDAIWGFAHLLNVRREATSPFGKPWRVKLSQVSAWTLDLTERDAAVPWLVI